MEHNAFVSVVQIFEDLRGTLMPAFDMLSQQLWGDDPADRTAHWYVTAPSKAWELWLLEAGPALFDAASSMFVLRYHTGTPVQQVSACANEGKRTQRHEPYKEWVAYRMPVQGLPCLHTSDDKQQHVLPCLHAVACLTSDSMHCYLPSIRKYRSQAQPS